MATFLEAARGIFVILILLGLGYTLARGKWIKKEESEFLTRLVVYVALPPYMVVNITTNFTRESLLRLGRGLPVPLLSMLLSYALGLFLGNALRIPPHRRGIFVVAFSLSNTIFVGLPVCQALFGEKAVPYVLLYYMVNTTLFWTLGAFRIASSGNEGKMSPAEIARRIFNPPFVAFFVGVLLVLRSISLPPIVLESSRLIGGLTTPLSLLCVGTTMDVRSLRLGRDLLLVLLGRFFFSPLFVLLVVQLFPLPELMREVFVVMSAMPVMMQSSILARLYGADYEYATGMIAATTALSALIIPLLKVGITYF
ncbi:MAG: AEC family transporter [Candidatus Caldatribacteriaceae bacterium]